MGGVQMQPMFNPQTGQPLQQQPMGMGMGMGMGMQPMFNPQTGQPGMPARQIPVAVAAPVSMPMKQTVTVQVPIYGGGGSANVEYNGNLINVTVPADAKAGSMIELDVPDMYKKSKGNGLEY